MVTKIADLENRYELAVILPTYNEAENIPIIVPAIAKALKGINFEIIVADDDSPDLTWQVAEELSEKYPMLKTIRRFQNRGLSGAVVDGMRAAQSKVVCVMDADMQHDEKLLPAMLKMCKTKKLVIGSRKLEEEGMEVMSPFRRFLSNSAAFLSGIFLGRTISDPMSGFFMLQKSHFNALYNSINPRGFKILLEFLVHTEQPDIGEIAYRFRNRIYGKSKLTMNVSLQYLIGLYELRFGQLLPILFWGYCLVGLTGILVNIAAAYVFGNALQLPQSGLLSFFVAMLSNFMLNNRFVFSDYTLKGRQLIIGLLKYSVITAIGGIIHFSISHYTYLPEEIPDSTGTLTGILVSSLWNFFLSASIVWKVSVFGPPQPKA